MLAWFLQVSKALKNFVISYHTLEHLLLNKTKSQLSNDILHDYITRGYKDSDLEILEYSLLYFSNTILYVLHLVI